VHADVMKLASDSGQLQEVTGLISPVDRYSILQFAFTAGVLSLRCNDDTDEIVVEVIDVADDHPRAAHAVITDLIGMSIEYAWTMTNHRGYIDAFQMRLMDKQRREQARQFEVAGSAMDVRRVVM
jgi:hypothetical protein